MFTSCCPAWVKYCETFVSEYTKNLSTCKSPQQMFGSIIKTYYAQNDGIDPGNICSVSVMPCTAKKFERLRPEMTDSGCFGATSGVMEAAIRTVFAVVTGGNAPKNWRIVEQRKNAIYEEEKNLPIRQSHQNPAIDRIYKEYLETPNGHLSHKHYLYKSKRSSLKRLSIIVEGNI